MADSREPVARTVDGRVLLHDARSVLLRAQKDGPVTVTDDRGEARMVISVAHESVPFNDD